EELDKEHEEAYKQIDWNAALDHVQSKEPQYIKRYHGIKKKPQSESEARKNMISYLKNIEGYKMEFFKGKTYDEILPIIQARFDANMKFLFKSREEMEKEDKEIIKIINETPTQKAAKRRKLSEEAQKANDLKKRLEIVQDEDDGVFVEATPLAQKVPVVDYQVVVIDNKPKYKIIKADDTHQFYISFTTLLKNFDREDLETLWRISNVYAARLKLKLFKDAAAVAHAKGRHARISIPKSLRLSLFEVHWIGKGRSTECSSFGALNVEDKILVPKLPKNYARCGHPVDGPYCQGCTLLRKKLEEDLVTYFQDFQNTSESSDDSTNVVNAPREPFIVKRDHGVNSSQNPPHIDECCYECGDALDGIFCQQCTCKSCRKGAHISYNCPQKIPICYDDDMDNTIAITLVLSTKEPDKSQSMRDEHLDTIPTTESDEVIKSSVKDLILIPSESEGILDTMCDVHLVNNPTPLEAKDHFEIVINSNDGYSSSDDDSLYNENIEYFEASPYDSELVSLEVAEIVILKDEEIEDDNLREKLLNVHLLIANIEALKDNPTPSFEFLTKSSSTSPKSFLKETNTFDNSLPEFENFCFN
nr:hypothetical protein [Tanacetum cinerariifolium]